jgi:Glycosyl Hydrolase Family 88
MRPHRRECVQSRRPMRISSNPRSKPLAYSRKTLQIVGETLPADRGQVHQPVILVDTLGMICPFLTRYGHDFAEPAAAKLALRQLSAFYGVNLDPDSGLPFHGYICGGPFRLGLHGWGRGVGWYLMGLVDTLIEAADKQDQALYASLQKVVLSLSRWQRSDGHGSWLVLMPDQPTVVRQRHFAAMRLRVLAERASCSTMPGKFSMPLALRCSRLSMSEVKSNKPRESAGDWALIRPPLVRSPGHRQ